MTDSIRETALKRMLVLLTGTSPNYATGAGQNVFRSRQEPLTRGVAPAIVIEPETEDSATVADYADRNEFTIAIAILVRGDVWDSLADPIAQAVNSLLMKDSTLDGLVEQIRRVGTQWTAHEADLTAGVLVARYRLTYLSDSRDLARPPQGY